MSDDRESLATTEYRLEVALIGSLRPGDMERVYRAVALASRAHEGQSRDDGTPYLVHPLRVALIVLEELGIGDPDMLCAAVLHDVLEDDKSLTPERIRDGFGPVVARTVATLTKPSKDERSREEVNQEYFPRVARADLATRLVKLADRLDNLRDLPHCPDAAKRRRKLEETRAFFLPLLEGLEDAGARATLRAAFAEAIAQAATDGVNMAAPQDSEEKIETAPHG